MFKQRISGGTERVKLLLSETRFDPVDWVYKNQVTVLLKRLLLISNNVWYILQKVGALEDRWLLLLCVLVHVAPLGFCNYYASLITQSSPVWHITRIRNTGKTKWLLPRWFGQLDDFKLYDLFCLTQADLLCPPSLRVGAKLCLSSETPHTGEGGWGAEQAVESSFRYYQDYVCEKP